MIRLQDTTCFLDNALHDTIAHAVTHVYEQMSATAPLRSFVSSPNSPPPWLCVDRLLHEPTLDEATAPVAARVHQQMRDICLLYSHPLRRDNLPTPMLPPPPSPIPSASGPCDCVLTSHSLPCGRQQRSCGRPAGDSCSAMLEGPSGAIPSGRHVQSALSALCLFL